ncbi:hypothetical protein N9I79_00910 [Gammaproteobacteria bacterium]|nr:hypothetical protein [Gammaproteobacteria bacterium]MDA7709501.1 hypothetical protein [Gammaproteobacteria bacterium]MDA8808576.1 hypothetical protein [Gammaproteobacteria bacterium]MDA8928704.1 hypothetical protein [Gammaproteobacteria bacterium]MDA9054015.1 hypothetical protein [Gammaproteobacteria bacterium]
MSFELEKALYGGFNFAKSNYVLIWVNGFIAVCATVLASVTIIGLLVVPAIWAGFTESLLRIRRGEEVKMGVFFKAGFNQWGSFFILVLLLALGIIVGFALLIIPGIYLLVAWYFVLYLKIDNSEMSISDSFGKSMDLVTEAGWFKIFLFVLIINVPVSIADAFTFSLASIILFPFVAMMNVEAYMLVSDKRESQDDMIVDNTEANI